MRLRIALTGVPGTGKTSVATALAAHGAAVIHLNEFAADRGLLGAPDPEHHGAREVDMDALADAVNDALSKEAAPLIVIEGHFAHEMDVDAIVLLRTDPRVLIERLQARGWPESKVRENVEAEALDVLAAEVMDTGILATEIDATPLTVEEIAKRVQALAEEGSEAFKKTSVGSAAWSLESLPWF